MAANGWMHTKFTTDGYAHNSTIRAHNTSNTQLTTYGCVHAHIWHSHTHHAHNWHTTAHTTPCFERGSVRFCVVVCLTRVKLNIVIGLQWSFAIRWKSDLWHGAVKFRYCTWSQCEWSILSHAPYKIQDPYNQIPWIMSIRMKPRTVGNGSVPESKCAHLWSIFRESFKWTP